MSSVATPQWAQTFRSFSDKLISPALKEKIKQSPLGKINLNPKQKKIVKWGGIGALILISTASYNIFFFESTDDAFVKAHLHTVSPRIVGTVLEVMVQDNQHVKKGDVLVRLDKRDYEVQVKAAQARYGKSHRDLGRFNGFENLGPSERPVFDQYQSDALVTEAELQKAQLQLEYTTIVAPEDGKIGKRNVETGELVQPGQPLMALIEEDPWIEANFKENQIRHFKPGQKVEIKVDAIPGKSFLGRLDSVSPGSGSTFSLLPPDNATGNFTKIVQRIPVKIVFDKEDMKGYEDKLISGMSTEVSVRIH
ncbi:HlyD family secretion protein [Bdellovibrio sp. KM01]|uniref:HlyD family secretion protein n=1 Tax=Bdellovibrio sp. KM01 TaxID=2748865 RepID=UPI0015EACB5F|nr:HlyD family secretion protein [Bdellovibrio sp. KM01]QLY26335.1 HlyD family secretion protein [Bdellovibrio sp. KM01]